MENFKTLFGKVVYIHYEGAIRQAKLDRVICRGDNYYPFTMYWLIAGCEPTCTTPKEMYFSAEDAEEEKNAIEFSKPNAEDINNCVKDFSVDERGYVHYWRWNGSRAVEDRLYYARLEFDGNTFVMKIDGEKSIPKQMYRTKEECKANNRPTVITF